MRFANIFRRLLILALLPGAALILVSCVPARLTPERVGDLQMSAHAGDLKSRVMIGEIYEFGAGVSADLLIAAQWYQLAAGQDDPEAQYGLGVMYAAGLGLKKNAPEAVRWLFRAAEQGHEKARILLAVLYLKEIDLRPDFARRMKGYRQKAEKGDAGAQYALGWIYLEGAGLPVNPREALKWLTKAAGQGNAKAQYALGGIYLSGRETPAKPEEALSWYKKSAAADIKARVKLCALYRGAGGLPENKEAAGPCLDTLARSTDASLRSWLDTQHAVLNSEKEKHPVLALRACGRIAAFDPAFGKVSEPCNMLRKQIREKMSSRIEEAHASLVQKDINKFRSLSAPFLTPDFDEEPLRELIASAWRLTEEENLALEKNALDQLRALEAVERTVTYRTANLSQINKLINAFKAAIVLGLRDDPDDPEVTALSRRGNKVIAGILQKIKPPPPPEEKTVVATPEEIREEADPAEADYAKARELFNSGRFDEAEVLLEKTTKTRGSVYIASAYIYLGISHLARINPAHVHEARKRHLKGLACFQNALRFDRSATLPAGYDKYSSEFNQAREQLH